MQIQYKTKDGTLFDDEQQATAHEAELGRKAMNFNPTILREYGKGATYEEALALSQKAGMQLQKKDWTG